MCFTIVYNTTIHLSWICKLFFSFYCLPQNKYFLVHHVYKIFAHYIIHFISQVITFQAITCYQTWVCSWPKDIRTCFEEVLEDTEAVSLFLGFFKLDLSSLETPLPVLLRNKNNVLEKLTISIHMTLKGNKILLIRNPCIWRKIKHM